MLKSLTLRNFRGFEDHTLPLKACTVAVGRNNAGQSTFIEALRLISVVTKRYRKLPYRQPPEWLTIPRRTVGVLPSTAGLQIDLATICYGYRDPPAEVEATFSDGSSAKAYVHPDGSVFATLTNSHGEAIDSRAAAAASNLQLVSILPQIAPLTRDETIKSRDYVLGALDSHLASAHFRNQLLYLSDYFDGLKGLAEETWPRLQVRELDSADQRPNSPLSLQIRNDDFVGEIGRMGHGLQMWLQVLWFLVRSGDAATLVLDEPDVYMHPDLQRRLVRYLQRLEQQVVIATHSVEIVSEVDAKNILVVERRKRHSRFANTIPAVQTLVENIGSAHNVHLARLWSGRRFIIIEGDDLRILKYFYDKLFPEAPASLEATPNMSIGGWGGWDHAVGSSMAMRNAFNERVHCYCILDRDYHSVDAIDERYDESVDRSIDLHVWSRKELENYLLVPEAISRVLQSRGAQVPVATARQRLQAIAQQLADGAISAIADELQNRNRGLGAGAAVRRARTIVRERSAAGEGLLGVVSGKEVLKKLNTWAQRYHRSSVSVAAIASDIRAEEIPSEVTRVLTAIHEQQGMPERERV